MNELVAPSAPLEVDSGHQQSMGLFTPKNLSEAMQLANILADSTIVPKDFIGKPGNVLIACQWGMELGLAPLQAMQSIAVINGRPAIWGDAMLALVQASGKLEDISEEITEDGETATCTIRRRGKPEPVKRSFTMAEAKRAGLAGKQGPWQQYPRRMLQLRARGFALRDAFADVLRGVAIAEEARDTPMMRDVTPQESGDPAQPKAEKLRGRIAAKKGAKEPEPEAAPTLKDVLGEIDAANDEKALEAAGAKAAKLTDAAELKDARAAYKSRLDALRLEAARQGSSGSAEPSLPLEGDAPAEDIGVLIERVRGWIRMELADGASLPAVLDAYAEQLSIIEKADQQAHDALIASLEEADAATA